MSKKVTRLELPEGNIINVSDICYLNKISRTSIFRYIHTGEFPRPHLIGNQRFWYRHELIAIPFFNQEGE